MDDEGARTMLTDEKILEAAAHCLTKDGKEGLEYDYSNSSIINFVRKILTNVKLQDNIKDEMKFIRDNANSFKNKFNIKSDEHACIFNTHGFELRAVYGDPMYVISWQDYHQWKQIIEGGE